MAERKAGRAKSQEKSPVESEVKEAFKTTLADQGAKLPLGVLKDGRISKNFSVKKWRTRDEIELGEKVPQNASLGQHVTLVVANMCSVVGPYNFGEMSDEERELAIRGMYMADVFYIYTYLRRQTMGNKLHLDITCSKQGCGVQFPYAGNLDTIEVSAVEDIDSILWQYKLIEPVEIRREKVTHFQMAYPKWDLMFEAADVTNQAMLKAMTIRATIVGLNDSNEPVMLTTEEIFDMGKRDFEQIQEALNDNFYGPKMAVAGECTKGVCSKYKTGGHPFLYPINWRYEDFFGASSR